MSALQVVPVEESCSECSRTGLSIRPIAEIEMHYPDMSKLRTASIADRIQGIAKLVSNQAKGRLPITLIYDNSAGEILGIVATIDGTFGFIRSIKVPRGQETAGSCAFHLSAKLASVSSRQDLDSVLKEQFASNSVGQSGLVPIELNNPFSNRAENEQQASFMKRLFASYQDKKCRHIAAPGHIRPPQPREVKRLLSRLLLILYPGYQCPLVREHDFRAAICRHVSRAQTTMARIVRHALAFHAEAVDGTTIAAESLRRSADGIVMEFFDAIPRIRELLDADVRAAYEGDPAVPKKDHHVIPLAYPGLLAVSIYRMAHMLYLLDVPYLPRMMTEIAHQKTGIDIHPGARINRGFFIDHGTGVVIGETAIIEANVTLYQGVTIGALNFPLDDQGRIVRGAKRHPTIRYGTKIFANASILGDITVGQNSTIGANVSLRKTIDPESIVRIPPPFREPSIAAAEGTLATADKAPDDSIAQDQGREAPALVRMSHPPQQASFQEFNFGPNYEI